MADKTPSISVVIPCFRGGKFLANAIESVLAQTEDDWELILVDNNASVETKLVIESYRKDYPEKIRAVHEKNQGNSSSRNKGLRESIGNYVAFLDDDDLMYSERLSLQRSAMEKNPEAVLCYGGIDQVSIDNQIIIQRNAKDADFPFFLSSAKFVSEKVTLRFPEPRPSSIMIRKEVLEKIGGFDEHFNPFFLEDTDFYFRIFQTGSPIEVPQPVIRFRMPSPEFLKTKRIDNVKRYRLLLNQDYFYSKIKKFLAAKSLLKHPLIRKDLSRMKARWLREASFDFMTIPHGERFARLLLWRAIKEVPTDFKSLKHLLRSFFPFSNRVKLYGNKNVYENNISSKIDKEFLNSLFEGNHRCPFCQNST